jgi:hypothetical protein
MLAFVSVTGFVQTRSVYFSAHCGAEFLTAPAPLSGSVSSLVKEFLQVSTLPHPVDGQWADHEHNDGLAAVEANAVTTIP